VGHGAALAALCTPVIASLVDTGTGVGERVDRTRAAGASKRRGRAVSAGGARLQKLSRGVDRAARGGVTALCD